MVIKPEERSLDFSIFFQRITKCLIELLAELLFELVMPVSSKMMRGQDFSSEAVESRMVSGEAGVLGLGWFCSFWVCSALQCQALCRFLGMAGFL